MDTEALNAVLTAATLPPLKPVLPRAMIVRDLQIQVKIGHAIREHRLRDHRDLDIARQEKQEWVQRCTELLAKSFNHAAAAEQFNNWVASILPEYAEFGLFVEHFEAEMAHRLNQLRTIAKSLREMPEPLLPKKDTAMATVTAPTTNEANPEVAAPTIAQAMQAAQAQAALRSQATRAATTSAQAASSNSRPTVSDKSGLLIVRCSADEYAACEAVRLFVEQLGLSLHLSKRAASESADQTTSTPLLDELSAMQSSPASFVLLFTNSAEQAQSSSADPDALFDLGCCVGKLGAGRVIVLHRGGEAHTDRFGLSHVVIDTFDGWRLQLARHLKRGGVDVDLNKLI